MLSTFFRSQMSLPGPRLIRHGRVQLLGLVLLLSAASAMAEEAVTETAAPESPAKNRYRVELLLFSHKNPADQEFMAQAQAPVRPAGAELLFGPQALIGSMPPGQNPNQSPNPDARLKSFSKSLLPTGELRLASAEKRLQNSGRYNVEFLVAWNEAFPPGHKTAPLLIQVGERVAGHADIEGYIQIDRQRYLHVNTQLYDLDLSVLKATPDIPVEPVAAAESAAAQATAAEPDLDPLLSNSDVAAVAEDIEPQAQVVTWLRETRRMRSGEVHLLDSPTMGLLVYFEPLD